MNFSKQTKVCQKIIYENVLILKQRNDRFATTCFFIVFSIYVYYLCTRYFKMIAL